jgi:hypothetical protein
MSLFSPEDLTDSDRRGSAARGIPPLITASQHDVPRPTLATFSVSASDPEATSSAEAFIFLCRLAEILRETLIMAFDLTGFPHSELSKRRRRIEVSLDDWEEDFKPWTEIARRENGISFLGTESMKLQYLSLRMLVQRLALHVSGNR